VFEIIYNKGNLNRHALSVHLNERLDCDMCEKSFVEKQNLLRHKENIHKDQSPKEHKQDFAYNALKKRKIFMMAMVVLKCIVKF